VLSVVLVATDLYDLYVASLAEDIKGGKIDQSEQQDGMQASAQTDLLQTSSGNMPPNPSEVSQRGSDASQAPVLIELLRQVAPLSSEEPEEILRFLCPVRGGV